eukprot:TRINITY_DN2467_c1_g1_i2.p1 TRINITY_DN2467_c1_g1~~TRINITY_DN2467_c1_g1_i2.p1  ORF type:complete len:387 (-),score=166.97 TRINITY_DN2467_c1_g1_i2:60-1220(-)
MQESSQEVRTNIMHDSRVIRGNTYANRALQAQQQAQQDPMLMKQAEEEKKRKARLRRRKQLEQQRALNEYEVPAVENRQHLAVQTEPYLEEIVDRVEEVDSQTQTDMFLDRPASPLFIPEKTGVDKETQIEEGDLFDFDFEVEPILEVLVGKILEQGLLEIIEEQELDAMRKHQAEYEQRRNAELAETQRMEAAEKRRLEEKERRMQQERERQERLLREQQLKSAQSFAQKHMASLQTAVFEHLSESGFFYDSLKREVETEFMPWLMDSVGQTLEKRATANKMVDALIGAALSKALEQREEAMFQQKEREELLMNEMDKINDAKIKAAQEELDEQRRIAAEKKAEEEAEEQRREQERREQEERERMEAEESDVDEELSDEESEDEQ